MDNVAPIEFRIKYDGLVYGDHTIDLVSLGESLQGFAKILATVGHFVSTGLYARQYSAQSVKVTTTAQLEKGSIDITAFVSASVPILFGGAGGAVLTAVVQHVLGRKERQKMEYLASALKQALDQNKELAENSLQMSERLLSTIERMADGLASARKQAVSPIGKSCKTISLLEGDNQIVQADSSLKEYFEAENISSVSNLQKFDGRLTELDKDNGNCKLTMDDDSRLSGVISDPALSVPGNIYIKAFAEDLRINVTAKAQIDKNGEVTKLFISDASIDEERPKED